MMKSLNMLVTVTLALVSSDPGLGEGQAASGARMPESAQLQGREGGVHSCSLSP